MGLEGKVTQQQCKKKWENLKKKYKGQMQERSLLPHGFSMQPCMKPLARDPQSGQSIYSHLDTVA
ncbi:unnamed protein product [Leuciscus chuanchicus]